LQRQALLEKSREVEGVKSLLKQYKLIGVANLHKVRAAQLQELKKKLEKDAYLRVVKNTLMEKAVSECKDRPNIEKLSGFLEGANIFLFTHINPFKLASLLEKSKVKMVAKAGDTPSQGIIVPAGNTGQPPGPIISQLNAVGIPTRIESGSVWINRDTVVAKKGEVISERLAAVLSKLGVKSVEAGLSLKVVYDDGLIMTEDQLRLNLEEFEKTIGEAYAYALNLSLNASYPTAENISMLIQISHREAYNLALNASVISPGLIIDLIRKAYTEALFLSSKVQLEKETS